MKNELITLLVFHLGLAAVLAQPVITNQPPWQTNIIGGTATFSVGATGTPPLFYQWRKVSTDLPGQTNSTLVFTNLQLSQQSQYSVVVSNLEGSVTSSNARLYVLTAPAITPAHPTASLFSDVTLLATIISGTPLSYQWLFNGNEIAGAVNNKLVMANVQITNAGPYAIVVSYAFGSVTSQVVTLTVTPFILTPFTITPANPTASLFADVTLLVTNNSGAPLSYQWLFNGEPIAGAVTNKLVLTNVQKTNAGAYAIVVTYDSQSVTSQMATLTITPFNSMYCFGFSWTDTHNCSWDPTMFYHDHACNGLMWPEFLSTNLGLAYAESNNYAVCGAGGVEVLNQVTSFPAPPKPELSLFCLMYSDDILWGFPPGIGGVYIDVTNTAAWDGAIQTGILNNSNAIHRLYAKGARTILVQGEIDAARFPRAAALFGTNVSRITSISDYCQRYNAGFFDAVSVYGKLRPDLHLIWVDQFTKLNEVVAAPAAYGFTKSLIDALSDPALADKSFSGPGGNYVFWNGLHGTSKLHTLMTTWNWEALSNAAPEELKMDWPEGALSVEINHLLIGRDYTVQTSSDLQNWNDVLTFTASAGTNQMTAALKAVGSAFYRLRRNP